MDAGEGVAAGPRGLGLFPALLFACRRAADRVAGAQKAVLDGEQVASRFLQARHLPADVVGRGRAPRGAAEVEGFLGAGLPGQRRPAHRLLGRRVHALGRGRRRDRRRSNERVGGQGPHGPGQKRGRRRRL